MRRLWNSPATRCSACGRRPRRRSRRCRCGLRNWIVDGSLVGSAAAISADALRDSIADFSLHAAEMLSINISRFLVRAGLTYIDFDTLRVTCFLEFDRKAYKLSLRTRVNWRPVHHRPRETAALIECLMNSVAPQAATALRSQHHA